MCMFGERKSRTRIPSWPWTKRLSVRPGCYWTWNHDFCVALSSSTTIRRTERRRMTDQREMNYVADRCRWYTGHGKETWTSKRERNIDRTSSTDSWKRKSSKNLILILFAFDYIFLYVLISRFAREKTANQITWTHLNDGSPGNCTDALRADIEGTFQEADVAGNHETTGDGRVDVTAADVSESLPREKWIYECFAVDWALESWLVGIEAVWFQLKSLAGH